MTMTKEELWALRRPIRKSKRKPLHVKRSKRKRRKASKASRRRNR